MNATFHAVLGISEGLLLSGLLSKPESDSYIEKRDTPLLLLAFAAGIVSHGILDITPHVYPISSYLDVAIAFLTLPLFLLFVKKRFLLIIAVAWLGNIFPDIVDHGPNYLAMLTDGATPRVELFPWHWRRFLPPRFYGRTLPTALTALTAWAIAGLLLSGIMLQRDRAFKTLRRGDAEGACP